MVFRDTLTLVLDEDGQDIALYTLKLFCMNLNSAAMEGRFDGILQDVEKHLFNWLSINAKDEILVNIDLHIESLGIYLALEELLDSIELFIDGSTLKEWIQRYWRHSKVLQDIPHLVYLLLSTVLQTSQSTLNLVTGVWGVDHDFF